MMRLKIFMAFVCLLPLFAHGLKYGDELDWHSKADTTIKARYVCMNNDTCWLLDADGNLYQVSPFQLTKESRDQLDDEQEKLTKYAPPGLAVSTLEVSSSDARSLALAETLVTTKLPTISLKAMPLSKAVAIWSQQIGEQATDKPEIVVEFADNDLEERLCSITLRNLDGARMLGFIVESVGCRFSLKNGEVIIEKAY